jgi:hypothetical protein
LGEEPGGINYDWQLALRYSLLCTYCTNSRFFLKEKEKTLSTVTSSNRHRKHTLARDSEEPVGNTWETTRSSDDGREGESGWEMLKRRKERRK